MLTDEPEFAEIFNRILADPSPVDRIDFFTDLARGVGRILMVNTVALEQLLNKIQSEHDIIMKKWMGSNLLPEPVEHSLKIASLQMAIVRAFMKHRDAIVSELREQFPDKEFPE